MLTLHSLTFLKYMSLQSNNVTIRMTIYYMILSLAVIESLKTFPFLLCLLVSFGSVQRWAKFIIFLSQSHSLLVNYYVIVSAWTDLQFLHFV